MGLNVGVHGVAVAVAAVALVVLVAVRDPIRLPGEISIEMMDSLEVLLFLVSFLTSRWGQMLNPSVKCWRWQG